MQSKVVATDIAVEATRADVVRHTISPVERLEPSDLGRSIGNHQRKRINAKLHNEARAKRTLPATPRYLHVITYATRADYATMQYESVRNVARWAAAYRNKFGRLVG